MLKKVLFIFSFFLLPALPLFFYLQAPGFALDTYTLSIILGVFAFMLVCGQFFLAGRPSIAIKALGQKGVIALHSTAPVIILVLALIHKLLKESNGFGDDTFQARFGSVAWWIFAIVIVLTSLFMANTFWLKIPFLKNLKTFVYKKTGLTYKGARLMHNITVLAGIAILIHVFLASSSDVQVNPVGFTIMAFWMLFSLIVYFNYRLKGRNIKGK